MGMADHSSTSSDAIVSWEGDEDPKNPLNWPSSTKWLHVAIISIGTFTM